MYNVSLIHSFLASYSQAADRKVSWSPENLDKRGGGRGGWDFSSAGSMTSSQSNHIITPLGSSTITNSDVDYGCFDDNQGSKTPTQHQHSTGTAPLSSGSPLGLYSPTTRQEEERMVTIGSSTKPSEHVRVRPPNAVKHHRHHKRQLFPPGSVSPGNGFGYPVKSAAFSSSSADARSSVTTSSELDFRKDLACLDTDIARLQAQFRVALQPSDWIQ